MIHTFLVETVTSDSQITYYFILYLTIMICQVCIIVMLHPVCEHHVEHGFTYISKKTTLLARQVKADKSGQANNSFPFSRKKLNYLAKLQ